jgi:5-methylcytosine-specific restriction endonuclease McrA
MAEIAKRDGYVCGLCGRMVPMKLWVPDSDAPTIDHILPIARGGQDTLDNVQLAHFLCNSTKSDRILVAS